MKEIWKDVKGYENYAQVSNLGRVRTLDRWSLRNGSMVFFKGRIRSPGVDRKGYLFMPFSVCREKSYFRVSRLVYEAFCGPLIEGLVIDHIDHNPLNNRVDNLRQITQRLNVTERRNKKEYTGVSRCNGKWAAFITTNGKANYLGVFEKEEEASRAYDKALSAYLSGKPIPKKITKNPTSPHTGVSYHNRERKWIAVKRIKGKNYYLGAHKTEEEARVAVDEFCKYNSF